MNKGFSEFEKEYQKIKLDADGYRAGILLMATNKSNKVEDTDFHCLMDGPFDHLEALIIQMFGILYDNSPEIFESLVSRVNQLHKNIKEETSNKHLN